MSGEGVILYDNAVNGATVTASSEAQDADYVKRIDPTIKWFATGKAAETLTLDFGAQKRITHSAVVAHNVGTGGTIQLELSNESDFSVLELDTGEVEAWDPVSGFGFDGFGDNLGGFPELTAFKNFRPLKAFAHGGIITARYARWTFKDPNNADITEIRVGRLFNGVGLQPDWNFTHEWSLEWRDPSQTRRGEVTRRTRRRPTYRVLNLIWKDLTRAEALGAMDDLKRIVGTSRDVLAIPFPDDAENVRYRTTVYGIPIVNAETLSTFADGDTFETALSVEEL